MSNLPSYEPLPKDEADKKIAELRTKLIGMVVTAKAARDGRNVYGQVTDVDDCGSWWRVTVLCHGVYIPCESDTVEVQGHAA